MLTLITYLMATKVIKNLSDAGVVHVDGTIHAICRVQTYVAAYHQPRHEKADTSHAGTVYLAATMLVRCGPTWCCSGLQTPSLTLVTPSLPGPS